MTGLLVTLLLGTAALLLVLPSGRVRPPREKEQAAITEAGIGDPALILDLLGALLTAGSSVEHALWTVAGSCEPRLSASLARVHAARMLGASWDAAWAASSMPPDPVGLQWRKVTASSTLAALDELREGLRFATSTGAPSAALLHAHAGQLRRRRNREVDRRAAALGVQLVLPLGLCSLPAFICLGVVPVVLGLLPDLQVP